MSLSESLLRRRIVNNYFEEADDQVLVRMAINNELYMSSLWVPFYHSAPMSIYFLYEFQTVLLSLMGKLTEERAGSMPPPLALRFTASSFASAERPHDIEDALGRYRPAGFMRTAQPRLHFTSRLVPYGNANVKPGQQQRSLMSNTRDTSRDIGGAMATDSGTPRWMFPHRKPVFEDDHTLGYRNATVSANVSVFGGDEAVPYRYHKEPYNAAKTNGVSLARDIVRRCKLCVGGAPPPPPP
jgi:hypothetical protein